MNVISVNDKWKNNEIITSYVSFRKGRNASV